MLTWHPTCRWHALALATALTASCASTPSNRAMPSGIAGTTDAWHVAIQTQDWDAMRALLSDGAVYEDPAAADERGVPRRHEGPDAIVAFWRSSPEDSEARNVRDHVDERFESGGGQ